MDGLAMHAERTVRARGFGPCALQCGREISPGQRIGKLAPKRWAHVTCIRARLEATAQNRATTPGSRGAVRRSKASEGERVGEPAEAAETLVGALF